MGAVCLLVVLLRTNGRALNLLYIFSFLYSDDDAVDLQKQLTDSKQSILTSGALIGQNPFLDLPESSAAVEYKKGYVMRKCCYDANYKKSKKIKFYYYYLLLTPLWLMHAPFMSCKDLLY